MQKEIEALQVKKRDLEEKIDEKHKTLQAQERNVQQLIVDTQRYERGIFIKDNELQSLEAKWEELEKKISSKKDTPQQPEKGKEQIVTESMIEVGEDITTNKEVGAISVQEQSIENQLFSEQQNNVEKVNNQQELIDEVEQYPKELETGKKEMPQQEYKTLRSSEQERMIAIACKQCGKPLPEDVKFCRYCGTRVS
jgi:chromosome segregation ATPase